MEAYARADLAQSKPDFSHPQGRGDMGLPPEVATETRAGSRASASSALAAALLDGLNESDLGLLAKRVAPHLGRLEERNPAVGHVAYTVHSLAADLAVSPKAIRCAIKRGELRAVKRGSRWIIPADAVNEWATPSAARRATARTCSPRAPKVAGPSLRSVLCAGYRGGSR